MAAENVVCCWGRNEDGQLGHGDAEDRLIPTLLHALDNAGIVSIVCGADHTFAYSESKLQVYSWGWYTVFFVICMVNTDSHYVTFNICNNLMCAFIVLTGVTSEG